MPRDIIILYIVQKESADQTSTLKLYDVPAHSSRGGDMGTWILGNRTHHFGMWVGLRSN